MQQHSILTSVAEIVAGQAIFSDDMPVWLGTFGADIWPLIEPSSPLFRGPTSSSIVWRDYIEGRGATLNHPNSASRAKYELCLTPEIVSDLKIAAVIHGYFPKLIKDARRFKAELDPITVKLRIDEVAKFFSLVILEGRKVGISISRLDQIPFSLLKEVIPTYPGRSDHLKRALKLISDPIVQKNLSSPLQWGLPDITKSSIAWSATKDKGNIPTLTDAQFLFLLQYCKRAVARFKWIVGQPILDSECRALPVPGDETYRRTYRSALDAYYSDSYDAGDGEQSRRFSAQFGVASSDVSALIREAHTSALMLILLFTGMRSSETAFLMRNCLNYEHGYWFLKSKVVKDRPKDFPISEGWLAVDLTRDAYEILSFICQLTGNSFLFSSPFPGFIKGDRGYSQNVLNTKFSKWFKRIDINGLFANWKFSIHQCRETLVFQLAKQEVGMPFISMQLKHFHSQFNSMPNAVTAGYGQYRSQLMASVANRIANARENALMDVYSENAKFAGGGGEAHKARIDGFFAGLGLFGERRENYIKAMARRGVKLMPTSIGSCSRNFIVSNDDRPPPCYGDYQCDPDCPSHVITERCAYALVSRKQHALAEAERETNPDFKEIWMGLAHRLDGHINKLEREVCDA